MEIPLDFIYHRYTHTHIHTTARHGIGKITPPVFHWYVRAVSSFSLFVCLSNLCNSHEIDDGGKKAFAIPWDCRCSHLGSGGGPILHFNCLYLATIAVLTTWVNHPPCPSFPSILKIVNRNRQSHPYHFCPLRSYCPPGPPSLSAAHVR